MIAMTAVEAGVVSPVAEPIPEPTAASTRRLAVVARTIAVLVPLLLIATITLHLHTGGSELTDWWLGGSILAAVLLIPGVLVAMKRPDNAIGWLLCLASSTMALAQAGREYLAFGFLGGTAPGYLWIGWFTDSLFAIAMACLPLILMLFPDGHSLSRRTRPLVVLPALIAVFGLVSSLFDKGGAVDVQGRALRNPARHVLPESLTTVASNAVFALFVVTILLSVLVLVLRYRRSAGETRVQMKWVVWAGSITAIELVSEQIPFGGSGNPIAEYTGAAASSLLAGSIAIAILRHRLFDIDLVINRTLVFAALSALVVGVYVGLVAATDAALGQPTRIAPGLIVTALVAVGFAPVRSAVQRGVDRLLYGQRRDPYGVLAQLGERLDSHDGTGELAVVVQLVTQALKLPYAGIFGPSGEVLAESGTPSAPSIEFVLTYQTTPMGNLLVQPRDRRAGFGRPERRLLGDLARQIGAAVHAVRLSADLQASRHRLVSAKEEERRRLRRDLHDGLGPKLAALGLKLDAACALVDADPGQSKDLMGTVRNDIRETIGDIRSLVYGLRPPALDELGLVAALRECGQRFDLGADAPEVTVSASDLPALPAAVEVAAYWIVNEALTNVVRHAGAARCTVRLWMDEPAGTLHAAVVDDGRGLPAGWRPGVGSSSMLERADELGGTLVVGPGPGQRGTQVTACLPLHVTVAP